MTTSVALSPVAILQFFDNTGKPAVGGTLLTQSGGVNYPTYSEATGTTALPNPIPLNSRGEVSTAAGASSPLFLQTGVAYTFTLKDSAGNQLWSIGSITAVNGQAVSFPTATGSGNAQIVTNAAPISLGNGTVQWFLPAAANTGATTLNVDGSGAKNVFYQGVALVGNELKTGVPAEVIYDGTQWNLEVAANVPLISGIQTSKYIYAVDTGTVNALAIAPSPAIAAYADGDSFLVKVANTTTNSTPTINVNALGAKNLYYPDGTTQILAGALILNNIYRMTYDSSLNASAGGLIVESPSEVSTSYTGTLTGCTTAPTGTLNLKVLPDGNTMVVSLPSNLTATSNSITCTVTGGPSFMTSSSATPICSIVINSGAASIGQAQITSAGTITLGTPNNGSGFTNTGTKGMATNMFVINRAA